MIIGAGGLGREVFQLVQDINQQEPTWQLLGFLDDDADRLAPFEDYGAVLGPIENMKIKCCAVDECLLGAAAP